MANVIPFTTIRKQTAENTITATIRPGTHRANWVEQVLCAARAEKAVFGVGDKVSTKCHPKLIGTVQQVMYSDTVRYLVSFSGIRCFVEQRELEKAGA